MTLWPELPAGYLLSEGENRKRWTKKRKEKKRREESAEQYNKISRMCNRNAHNLYKNVYEMKRHLKNAKKIAEGSDTLI